MRDLLNVWTRVAIASVEYSIGAATRGRVGRRCGAGRARPV